LNSKKNVGKNMAGNWEDRKRKRKESKI